MASLRDGTYYIVNAYRGEDDSWRLGDQAIYRLYNPYGGIHHFTASFYEYTQLARAGWNQEGIAFRVTGTGNVPVFRLYNPYDGTHHLTTSTVERDSLVNAGWVSEGVAWYGDSSGNVPVWRIYNESSGEHLWTASRGEYDALVSRGWIGEGRSFDGTCIPCLDTAADALADGVNVCNGSLGYTTSQAWVLSTRPDGTRRIVNRHTGKTLDAYEADGGRVQQWSDSPSRNQSWDVEDTGETLSVGSGSGAVCTVTLHGKTLALDLFGTSIGESAIVKTVVGSITQKWAFVEPSPLQSEHVYELRSMSNTSLALDVSGGSATDGANVQLWGAHHGNNQKFWLCDEGDGWSIRNIQSGKYVDVASGVMEAGTNVQQWRDNDTRAQRWAIEVQGSATVDGVACAVVTIGADNGHELMLSAGGAAAGTSPDVKIDSPVATSAQQWALLPTTATDPNVPVPANLCLCSAVGKLEGGDRAYQERLYPGWECTDAWMVGDNHYRLRWRARYCDNRSSRWGSWGPWHGWSEPGVTRSGRRAWLTDGIDTSYDAGLYKNAEFEVQVRCVGAGAAEDVTGAVASAAHRNTRIPSVTFGTAGWSLDGLRIDYTTDYPYGATNVYVTGLRVGGTEALVSERAFTELDPDSSILIPWEDISSQVADGATVEVTYQKGNDQNPRWTWTEWSSGPLTVSYNAGSTDIGVEVVPMPDRTLDVSVRDLGSGFVIVRRGGDAWRHDAPRLTEGGRAHYRVEYPFSSDFEIYVAQTSADQDSWGVWHSDVGRDDPLVTRYGPAHCWSWNGGEDLFMLEVDTSRLRTKRSLVPEYSALSLNGRGRQAVTFGTVTKSAFTAEGHIVEGASVFGVADLDRLQSARHATYRAPSGEMATVAIVGVEYERDGDSTKAVVSMIEEVDAN